jgi:hypothetical protein
MTKSQVKIEPHPEPETCELKDLKASDAFLDDTELYIVYSAPGHRRDGCIECVRMGPTRGSSSFNGDRLVKPVDIKIEWKYA